MRSILRITVALPVFLFLVFASGCTRVELFPALSGGKWGFIDSCGKMVIQPRFEFAKPFGYGDLAPAAIRDGALVRWGLVDKKGNWVVEPQYEIIPTPFFEVVPAAIISIRGDEEDSKTTKTEREFVLLDLKGHLVFPFAFEKIVEGSRDGLVMQSGEKGVKIYRPSPNMPLKINSLSSLVQASAGFEICWMPGSAIGMAQERIYVIIDSKGNLVVAPGVWDKIGMFSEGLSSVQKNGKWGFIGRDGKVVVELRFDDVEPFSGGFSIIRIGKFCGIIDKEGKEVIPAIFSRISILGDGVFSVSHGGVWGLMDDQGVMLVSPRFCEITPFAPGLWRVSTDGRSWWIINRDGHQVTETKYISISELSDGMAVVATVDMLDDENQVDANRSEGHLFGSELAEKNTAGELDDSEIFGTFGSANRDVSDDEKGVGIPEPVFKKFGYIDRAGKMVIPALFTRAGFFFDGLAVVEFTDAMSSLSHPGRRRYQQAVIDRKGDVVIAFPGTSDTIQIVGKGKMIQVITADGFHGYYGSSGEVVWPLSASNLSATDLGNMLSSWLDYLNYDLP